MIAAAGWGKTASVASWSPPEHSAWLRCAERDEDLTRFVGRLVAALRPHLPASRMELIVPDGAGRLRVGSVVAALCGWLERLLRDDVVLVVDDLHTLRADGAAVQVLQGLCLRGPERLRLVLISRRELPFSVQRLRGRGEVAELGAQELGFDVSDVAAVLRQQVGEAAVGLAKRLWECTSGWPAAVGYAVELLRAAEPEQWIATLSRLCCPGEWFHDYVREEVLGAESERVRRVLRRFAVVEEVGTGARAALGADDAVLAELVRRGLLVRRNDAVGVRFTLVAPLAEYFAHEATLSAADKVALHVKVGEECLRRCAHAEALRHFLAAGRHTACVRLLLEHGDELIRGGQPSVVLRAADLPASYLRDPRIQQVLGRAREVCGQWAEARLSYRRADSVDGDRDDAGRDRDDALEPGFAWRVAALAFVEADFRGVVAVCDRARLTGANPAADTEVLALAATAHRMMGDLGTCRILLARASRAVRHCEDPAAWSAVFQGQAMLAAAEGDRRRASALCGVALRSAHAAGDLLRTVWVRTCRAFHLLAMGSPGEAAQEAAEALGELEGREIPFLTAHALTTRGRAAVQLGRLDAAQADLATAVELFQRLGSRFLAWPLCGLGDLYRIRGHLVRARGAYEEALAVCKPGRDAFGHSYALSGLARVRAADDLAVATDIAERAVGVGENLRAVPAYLTRGWVALLAGDRQAAAADAARASAVARPRRDSTGLAEASTLEVLCSASPASSAAVLAEQIGLWRDHGCVLEEAAARIVAARVQAPLPALDVALAHDTLRKHGVDLSARRAAGPIAVLSGSAPVLAITALGVFRVLRDGVPVSKTEWQSRKARDLLRILVARGRPVPREQLIEMLWPDADPGKSGNRLSVLLSTVREVLAPTGTGGGPLCSDELVVWLDPTQVRIDVEEFLGLARAALDAHREGRPDAVERLQAAADSYTGGFLEDDPYHDWAQPLAEELRAVHGAVLHALVARRQERGDIDGVVWATLRLLEDDPYDEPAHHELVAALLAGGHLGEARRRYRIYARLMAEIGVDPRPFPTRPR